jgi:hypothetical protein
MQEEISQRSITLIVQTGKMTGKVFLQAIQKYLDFLKQQQQQKARDRQLRPAYQGRMTIKELMKERSGLSNIEIHDEHIHDFERIARIVFLMCRSCFFLSSFLLSTFFLSAISFFPYQLFPLFTLFTPFFDSTKAYFHCKNWLVVNVRRLGVRVRILSS